MSEPLTSHEIEDVLSSIRRLVSEDLRPAARSSAAAASVPPARPAEGDAGKLLLTPALRVVPESAAEVEALSPTASSDAAGATHAAVADPEPVPMALDATAAETLVNEAAPSTAAPAATYDDEGWNRAGDAEDGPSAAVVAGLRADAADTPSVTLAHSADTEGETWEDGTELIWSSVGAPPDPVEDEGETVVPTPPATEGHGHWSAQDVPGTDWVQEEGDWVEADPMPFVAHPRKPTLADDPLARAWADRAEAEVRAHLEEPAKAAVPPAGPAAEAPAGQASRTEAGPGLFDGAETEIDEETLRDIVRDIIREELAGTLGERITRNVRKLVRVEINRALTAREFE